MFQYHIYQSGSITNIEKLTAVSKYETGIRSYKIYLRKCLIGCTSWTAMPEAKGILVRLELVPVYVISDPIPDTVYKRLSSRGDRFLHATGMARRSLHSRSQSLTIVGFFAISGTKVTVARLPER